MPCIADRCQQGHKPCPSPDVCRLDDADDPVATPEDAMGWLANGQGIALLIAVICAGMAARYFINVFF